MMNAWLPVVAGAIMREDGRWLMHRRPAHKHHGGLWEFPGGKVEVSESPVESLVRELAEELGIAVMREDCQPLCFAEEVSEAAARPIVILLYSVSKYTGEPRSLEGGEVGWFTPEEAILLEKPPLDDELCGVVFAEARGHCG